MVYKDFVFKGEWQEKLSQLTNECEDMVWLHEAIIIYGMYGVSIKDKCELYTISQDVVDLFNSIKKDIDSQRVKTPKKEKTKIPPTLDEVIQYVKDNNLDVDPYQFWNFYESKGWFVGKNKMKNWHSAVATWVKRKQENYNGGQQQSNIINKVADILAD